MTCNSNRDGKRPFGSSNYDSPMAMIISHSKYAATVDNMQSLDANIAATDSMTCTVVQFDRWELEDGLLVNVAEKSHVTFFVKHSRLFAL